MFKTTRAGFRPMGAKALKGARLYTPFLPMVETHAMGRGKIALMNNSCRSLLLRFAFNRSIFIE
jgi:hypothetical protein